MTETLRILVVEDKYLDQELIVKQLGNLEKDIEVVRSANVSRALKLLSEYEFDIAIIDIDLGPDPESRSGIDILRVIDKNYPKSLAIVTTIWDNSHNQTLCFQHGARGLVSKVSLEKELCKIVKGAMERTSVQPSFTELGKSLLRRAEGLPEEERLPMLVELMHQFGYTHTQLKVSSKASVREFKFNIVASSMEDAAKLKRNIDNFVDSCHWINENLPAEIIARTRAQRTIRVAAVNEFKDRVSSTQIREAIGVVASKRKIESKSVGPDDFTNITFEPMAVYNSDIMGIDTLKGIVGLAEASSSHRRVKLDISAETDSNALKRFEKANRGELTYLEGCTFQLALIFT